jgi:hypothetical protein
MSRRQKRTTRTVRFLGGPMHEKLVQIPHDVTLAQFTAAPGRFDHYVGPAGAGAAVFAHDGVYDLQGNRIPDPPSPLRNATFHVKPDGSDEWHEITSVSDITLHHTGDAR